MKTNINSAPSASNNSKAMTAVFLSITPSARRRALIVGRWAGAALSGLGLTLGLVSCGVAPRVTAPEPAMPAPPSTSAAGLGVELPDPVPPSLWSTPETSSAWRWADNQALAQPHQRAGATWTPVRWRDLPGWGRDNLGQAWNAWLRNCERPLPAFVSLCADVRRLSWASVGEQHEWLMTHFQPYRVQNAQANDPGLLTGYFEPEMAASRRPSAAFPTPIHALPSGWSAQSPWYSRQEMDTLPEAQQALAGKALAYLAHPVDALMLQVQGSGRLRIAEPDGRITFARLAFAGHNGHTYQSVATPLLRQKQITSASWEAIKAWAQAHPDETPAMLWQNPRVVFFQELALDPVSVGNGPRGALGVALTPGRSIAVDRQSMPYGTPVWLVTSGPTSHKQKLVFAQDTGGAIVGAVRADYFAGWGDAAYQEAARLKQPLSLWALWPRHQPLP